jgi:hypothetical protein
MLSLILNPSPVKSNHSRSVSPEALNPLRAQAPKHAVCAVFHWTDLKSDVARAAAPGFIVETCVVGQRPHEVMEQVNHHLTQPSAQAP